MEGLKVLLVADSYWPVVGGGETHSRILASELSELGAQVTVVTQNRFAESPLLENLDGIPVHRVGIAGYKRFGKYFMLPGLIRWLYAHRDEFDVAYVCGLRILGAPVVFVCHRMGKPVALRIESCEELSGKYIYEHLTGKKALAIPLARTLVAWRNKLILKADSFVAISRVIKREYQECGVPDVKIASIFNGVDLSLFIQRLQTTEIESARGALGLPLNRTLLVYTGKLNKGKGIEYLLQAMKQLLPRWPDLHLVLVGGGSQMFLSVEKQLREYVASHGMQDAVTFAGYQTNVGDYLKVADLFSLPSEMEALGISIIEASAAGLPVVATDVGGIPDVVRHEQEALLIPPRDAQALESALERLLSDAALCKRLGVAGRERAHELFDIASVSKQHLHLFEQLVNTKSGNS